MKCGGQRSDAQRSSPGGAEGLPHHLTTGPRQIGHRCQDRHTDGPYSDRCRRRVDVCSSTCGATPRWLLPCYVLDAERMDISGKTLASLVHVFWVAGPTFQLVREREFCDWVAPITADMGTGGWWLTPSTYTALGLGRAARRHRLAATSNLAHASLADEGPRGPPHWLAKLKAAVSFRRYECRRASSAHHLRASGKVGLADLIMRLFFSDFAERRWGTSFGGLAALRPMVTLLGVRALRLGARLAALLCVRALRLSAPDHRSPSAVFGSEASRARPLSHRPAHIGTQRGHHFRLVHGGRAVVFSGSGAGEHPDPRLGGWPRASGGGNRLQELSREHGVAQHHRRMGYRDRPVVQRTGRLAWAERYMFANSVPRGPPRSYLTPNRHATQPCALPAPTVGSPGSAPHCGGGAKGAASPASPHGSPTVGLFPRR